MKEMVRKFPSVLRDSLSGSDPFKGQPHKSIDLNPDVTPHYEQGICTTPHHIRTEAQKYIKHLIDEDIIEPQ